MLDRSQIEKLIPHRTPFLWLDEIIALDETEILARKYLDPSLDVFAGHYPHFPVLPGVILCEMAMQAAAVFIARSEPVPAGTVPVATRLNNTQFRRIVRPGETVEIHVELTEKLANAYFFRAKLTVEEQTAARLEFACAAAPASAD